MKQFHQIYLDKLLSLVDLELIKQQHCRVLVDPCNGAASELLPKLLELSGCQVIKYNCEINELPKRAPEPRRESLQETARAVLKNRCDLGLATDMDADRVLFIDELGEVLSEDLAGAILAPLRQDSGGAGLVFVTPLNSSGLFKSEMKKVGAKVIECRVGPPEITMAIKKHRAVFAYEESGKYFFSRYFNWADGLFSSLKMLEIMAKLKQKLSVIRLRYPVYHQVKLAVKCPMERMPKRWIGEGEKQIFGDSFMFIRASGTEPLIRIFSDSPSLKQAQILAEKGKKLVETRLCVK